MKRAFVYFGLLVILLTVVLASGCTKPAEKELIASREVNFAEFNTHPPSSSKFCYYIKEHK